MYICSSNINSKRKLSGLLSSLKDHHLKFIVELYPDHDALLSLDWFFKQLDAEGLAYEKIVKFIHKCNGLFCLSLECGNERKIIFSNSDSHLDCVRAKLITEKNFLLILNNLLQFLELKFCKSN
jgi:hypothetical protein